MAKPICIVTRATVPPELANAWMQHLRNFDAAHPGCHFEALGNAAVSVDEMVEMLRVDPPFPSIAIVPRK